MRVPVPIEGLLAELNGPQRQAVEAPDGPLLIFAGAGSGKTRVLTHRIVHVVANRGVRAHEICAVTFTNKAAREMRARVETLLGERASGMWLGTFHSLGARLLRREGEALGIARDFTIYDEADRIAALRVVVQSAGIDEKRFPPSRLGHEISAAKNQLLDARAYRATADGPFEHQVARAFEGYERALEAAAAVDFDDLLVLAVRLLGTVAEVRERYQARFRHVFVDEYQDTNHAQYRMVSLLAARYRNLTVVGDDDQSIYGWRGADVGNILSFHRDYPDAVVVTLDQNYRSTQVILDAAHSVIQQNRERSEKRLWTDRRGGARVRLISVYDEREEALAVCTEIESLISNGEASLTDCAVLYRTNAQSRAFEDAFLRRGVPYRLVGGTRFYERREVKDVLAYLHLIANPRDSVSFARIVNVPRRKIGARTLAELDRIARGRQLPALEVAEGLDGESQIGAAGGFALGRFAQLVKQFRELSQRVPPAQLIDEVVTASGYQAMVRDRTPEGEERWANVVELMGLAGEYADLPPPAGLQQFLENVALVSDTDDLDSGSGVTLITLHQVKGLEYPVVFLAGMEEGLLPHVRALEAGDAGIAEERRLAYVGITRAQRRLYLLHAFRRHLYGAPQIAEASRFLADIPREILDIPRRPGAPPVSRPRAPGAVRAAVHAHAARPNPVVLPPPRFTTGVRVRHPTHGAGTILKSTMTRAGEEVVIHFEGVGVKIFGVADTTLELIQ